MSVPNPEDMNSTLPPPLMPSGRGHWGIGLALACGCILMVIPLALAVGAIASQFQSDGAYLGLIIAAVFGLSQWLFVVPLGLYLRYRGKTETAMGLWITAGLAMLLNGACFGLMGIF